LIRARTRSSLAIPLAAIVALVPLIDSACADVPAGPNGSLNGGGTGLGSRPVSDAITDGNGHTLKSFVQPTDPGAGGFVITISGESNALVGYPYPPFDPSSTWMVDGWNWRIDEYIVVVDHVLLWSNPNKSPSDQSQHGAQVAHASGPFVVDLHKGGPIQGAGGAGEEALALTTITSQNDNGGQPFDPTIQYGFGFSTVQAPGDGSAINVNLTSDEEADYQLMVKNGYSVFYSGTATWAGNAQGATGDFAQCTQTSTGVASTGDAGTDGGDAGPSDGAYDFTKLPPTMKFALGFSTPTNYVNCVNYTLSAQTNSTIRGVQTSPSQSELEQITVHMDHPFWESFQEDTPVHWDQIAAQYIGVANPVAHTEDMKGVPFNPFTDKLGNVMPWRDCEAAEYTPPGNGAMSFSTLSVPQNPNGVCTGHTPADFSTADCPAIRDYYDFMRYTQSTQGHLNSQGLCFIDRQYPAPAGGS
jgi:hypothetical protein